MVRWPPAACLLDLDPHPLLHPAPSRSGRSCLPSCSRQQHVVADNGAVCAGDNRGLLPDLGKWTTVRQSGQCKPHQISRRYPFWCSEICCTGFYFFYEWMNVVERFPPFGSIMRSMRHLQNKILGVVEVHMEEELKLA